MDGEADSRKPLQTGALENGFEYLTDNPDNSILVTRSRGLVSPGVFSFRDFPQHLPGARLCWGIYGTGGGVNSATHLALFG